MFARSELAGARLVWLAELTLRGKVYRFAEQHQVIHTKAGQVLQYLGSLQPLEYPDEGGPWDAATADRFMSLEVVFGAEGYGVIASDDHDLGDARCEVSLWREGDTYEDRKVVLDGAVDEPEYSDPEEPVSFSVRESALLDRGRILSPLAKVTAQTWPTDASWMPDPAIVGEPYPLPVGQMGALVGGLTDHNGSPALLVKIDVLGNNTSSPAVLLLGDGELSCIGGGVTVHNRTQGLSCSASPFLTQDGLGRLCTVVSIAVSDMNVEVGDELWVSFTTAGDGGIRNSRGVMMEGAGDLVEWALGKSTLRIDSHQLRGALELLNGYRMAFPYNQDMGAWELAQDIVAQLPASLGLGRRGLQLAVWRLGATEGEALEHIDTSRESGGLTASVHHTSTSEIANVVALDYAQDPAGGEYRLRLVYGPEHWMEPEASFQPHPLCSASFTRYSHGGHPMVGATLQGRLVQDPGTAAAILQHEAMRRCGTHRVMNIDGLSQKWQGLNVGDVILVSHAPIGWVRQVCLVTSVLRAPGSTAIQVLNPNNWVRDATLQ